MNSRKIEVLIDHSDAWESIEFEDLRKGMIFRMFEATGELVEKVIGNKGDTDFVAISDPYMADGILQIEIED
jgi:hypothetical protein